MLRVTMYTQSTPEKLRNLYTKMLSYLRYKQKIPWSLNIYRQAQYENRVNTNPMFSLGFWKAQVEWWWVVWPGGILGDVIWLKYMHSQNFGL